MVIWDYGMPPFDTVLLVAAVVVVAWVDVIMTRRWCSKLPTEGLVRDHMKA